MQELTIRRYDPSDFETLKAWWDRHGFAGMQPEMLPRIGFVVEGICAGFVYQTDSAWALFEWVVSNPESEKESRRAGLDLLIEAAIHESRELGFKLLFSTIKHPALIKRYENHGFIATDRDQVSLVRSL